MGKKLNALANGDDQNLAEAIRESAQEIWQAGLGAFAVAEREGGKLFSKLVKDGVDLQKRTQHLTDFSVPDMTDAVSKMASNINKQASGSWEKIEKVFEERVSKTLTQLGVPTSRDMQELTRQVEELSMHVAQLVAPAAPTAVRRTRAAKPAAAVKVMPKVAARKTTARSNAAK